MSAPFIDDTGFNSLGFNGWLTLLTAQYQSVYGSDIDVSSNSPDGQWLNILAGDFTDLEQLAMDVYNGLAPAGAVGTALSRLVQLNGISRKPAQFSTAPALFGGTNGTVIPAGSLVGSNSDPTKPSWQTPGTSPTGDLTIGGGGTVAGTLQCTVAGPIAATSTPSELTVIQSQISGWTSVANTADAVPGMLVEADPALRVRRASSVAMPSQSLLDGLQGAIEALSGVTDAVVYENPTGATDSKGLPPHSINAIVLGGASADIANALWTKASMGVTKVGAQSFTVTDIQGNPQVQNWDVPTDVDVYITIKLSFAPINLAYIQAQFAAAIVAYYSPTGALPAGIGQNIAWFDIATPVNALGLTGKQGLPSVTNVFLGSAPSPVLQADLVVFYNQLAVLNTGRILVTGP